MRKLQRGDCVKDITHEQIAMCVDLFNCPFSPTAFEHAKILGIYYSDVFNNVCIPYHNSAGFLTSNPLPFDEFYEMAKLTVQ